jgi:high affinity Mn2+ porin
MKIVRHDGGLQSGEHTLRSVLVFVMLAIPVHTLGAQDVSSGSLPDSCSASLPDSAPARRPFPSGPDKGDRLDGTGFYIGAHAGVLGGPSAWTVTKPAASALSGSLNVFIPYGVFDGSGSQFGGLAAGYNYVRPSRMVIGVEADVSFVAKPIVSAGAYNDAIELSGTARGRIGYKADRWLPYATGGLAWTRDQFTRADFGVAGDPAGGAVQTTYAGRIGWAAGAGIEVPVGRGWTAKAEYFYSRFGNTTVPFPIGAPITSDLSMHEVRVGLNYKLGDSARPDGASLSPLDVDGWLVHGQTAFVSQYAAPFHAPYHGANSLDSNAGRETWDATLYVGRRLWKGGELWINPEIDQGYGLSNTLGVAGFTSGEAYKVGYASPYLRLPRVFLRQTFTLGGGTEILESGLNQFAGSQTANRLVVTAGRFSVSDLFDTITYAHDPRGDFLNWSLVDAGTFDYAADAWGFTYGAALEWYQGEWTARAGFFDLSIVPNSIELDHRFEQFQVVGELEHRHEWIGQPGKLAVVGFLSRGRMGRYDDAIALGEQTGAPPSTADVRRYAGRPGVNLNVEQGLVANVGIFGRVGWAGGQVEPFEFTDIDRTASAGLSLAGKRWGRPDDTFGLAAVINGISDVHGAYLAAGGLGILAGDGQLPHPGLEKIVETYYRLPFVSWQVTANYQFIVNPAFNRDRGPVSVFSVRLRTQF